MRGGRTFVLRLRSRHDETRTIRLLRLLLKRLLRSLDLACVSIEETTETMEEA